MHRGQGGFQRHTLGKVQVHRCCIGAKQVVITKIGQNKATKLVLLFKFYAKLKYRYSID